MVRQRWSTMCFYNVESIIHEQNSSCSAAIMVGMTASLINSYFIYSFHLSFQDPEPSHIYFSASITLHLNSNGDFSRHYSHEEI